MSLCKAQKRTESLAIFRWQKNKKKQVIGGERGRGYLREEEGIEWQRVLKEIPDAGNVLLILSLVAGTRMFTDNSSWV